MVEPWRPVRGARRWLVIMAKEPRAGAVKTRLANDIGLAGATAFYRKSLQNVARRLARDPRWTTLIAVAPDISLYAPVWPDCHARVGQGPGDLGVRMQRLFDGLPPGPVVIVGTDIPEIDANHVASAFRALGTHDAVLGPGSDGGYWLVGLRRVPHVRAIFQNVRWSSPHTLSDTLANLAGATVAQLATLEDVDDGASFHALGYAGSRLVLPAGATSLTRD